MKFVVFVVLLTLPGSFSLTLSEDARGRGGRRGYNPYAMSSFGGYMPGYMLQHHVGYMPIAAQKGGSECPVDSFEKSMLTLIPRMALMVVESGRRKSPCVCAGMCTVDDSSEEDCQVCQMYMGHFNFMVEKILELKEQSGVYLATVKELANRGLSQREMDQVSLRAADAACLRAELELEGHESQVQGEMNSIVPLQPAFLGRLRQVVDKCQSDQWRRYIACLGGVQHLKLSKNLFPLIEPSNDHGQQLKSFASSFLKSLIPSHTAVGFEQAAASLGGPNFGDARMFFNSGLCMFAGVPVEECGLASPAFVKIAAHRSKPLLAAMYEELEQLLLATAQEVGGRGGRGVRGGRGYGMMLEQQLDDQHTTTTHIHPMHWSFEPYMEETVEAADNFRADPSSYDPPEAASMEDLREAVATDVIDYCTK